MIIWCCLFVSCQLSVVQPHSCCLTSRQQCLQQLQQSASVSVTATTSIHSQLTSEYVTKLVGAVVIILIAIAIVAVVAYTCFAQLQSFVDFVNKIANVAAAKSSNATAKATADIHKHTHTTYVYVCMYVTTKY